MENNVEIIVNLRNSIIGEGKKLQEKGKAFHLDVMISLPFSFVIVVLMFDEIISNNVFLLYR